ncbi:chromosomal replication initiator DnaA [Starkeya koreensis]|uniref:Chromosomal replication initiator DnaA n=1 Tax=Ancylobacter koreensis TaxID=266121 RepID=A0ABT0DP37_9HYPH|nr:helix-turn-helix domain-containing protein [Ancylobacter koreensis]MCK0209053.1 chromosomal replication initiator DnaA [Ancylobacter koreensis]
MPVAASRSAPPSGALACLVATRLAAEATGLPMDSLLHPPGRDRRCASARALAMYLAHVGLGLPMTQVASGFGRHRSTVAYACRQIEERREVAGWDRRVAALEESARVQAGAPTGEPTGGAHG